VSPAVDQVINAPVFTVNLVDDGQAVSRLQSPVTLHLRERVLDNRTGPQCVYWRYSGGQRSVQGVIFTTDLLYNGWREGYSPI
jgi:hypothetical protein